MNDQSSRYVRLRYTAMGALAALAAVGAIAGAVALASNPRAKPQGRAAVASGGRAKSPATPVPARHHASQPGSSQPFLSAVQRLLDDGTITATEGQAVDREILAGTIDPQTLSGFTQAQLQAVEQALSNTKRALAMPRGQPAQSSNAGAGR